VTFRLRRAPLNQPVSPASAATLQCADRGHLRGQRTSRRL